MSKDTDLKLTFHAPTRKQLQHVLDYMDFKKRRWDAWTQRRMDVDALKSRIGVNSSVAVVARRFTRVSEIEETSKGSATIVLNAWASENRYLSDIPGYQEEITDLRRRFSFLTVLGT